jgi:CHAT domain-containing protein
MLACVAIISAGASAGTWEQGLGEGERAREFGNISESVARLEQAVEKAPDNVTRVRAMTQLGLSLLQARRLAEADKILQAAYGESTSHARISIALALGNVAAAQHDPQRAAAFYQEVIASAGDSLGGQDAQIAAELNLARLRPPRERLATLENLYPRVETIKSRSDRARAFFSLGQQTYEGIEMARVADLAPARKSGSAPGIAIGKVPHATQHERVLRLTYRSLSNAADLAQQSGDGHLGVEASNGIAELYEAEGRLREALEINRTAVGLAESLPLSQVEGLLVKLEWQAGRLNHRLGDDSAALGGYLRAAHHLEAMRQDLPIDDETGQSTYQTLLKPIFVNLTDLMLKDQDRLSPAEQQARLASILDVVELTRQAEMQDYLGDRCSVEAVSQRASDPLKGAIGAIYPIVLKDRLEVIVKTKNGLLHHAAPVSSSALKTEIMSFHSALVDSSSNEFLAEAQKLYGWLIKPFETELAQSGVRELVVVPDGYLRLVPFAALHDGRQFVAERYFISTVTGLTMTERTARRGPRAMSLLAGLSEPGPVVDRLISMGFEGSSTGYNTMPPQINEEASESTRAERFIANKVTLKNELALPWAKTEIQELASLARSVTLLNSDFTLGRFQREIETGRYRVVHIASHGYFGGTAHDSFLLAYDNVIRMDDLQRLISVTGTPGGGIELLTLSACDTAQGDDRAPLGFAGAAIKARAQSVVGSLWAVSDDATQRFMGLFYAALAKQGRAEALTQAQRTMLQSPQFSHPYYWAPFLLIGDWN